MLHPSDIPKLAAANEAALKALQAAGSKGIDTLDGIKAAGTRFSARAWELSTKHGWIIEKKREPGSMLWRYTLIGRKDKEQLSLDFMRAA